MSLTVAITGASGAIPAHEPMRATEARLRASAADLAPAGNTRRRRKVR